MADEKGLDLSLGLPCGGNNNTSSSKAKCSTSSDTRSTEEDRGHKLINEFKNFLEGGNQHSLKAKESSSYQQFSKTDHHHHHHHHSETSKSIDERPVMVGEKRKSLFFMADEGSTAENEDIADSEKDGFGHSDSTEIFVQKRSAVLLENELKSADETTILPSYPLIQGTGGAHFPVMFGYPSAQLPTLDNASFLGRNLVNQSNPAAGTTAVPVSDSSQHDNGISEDNAKDGSSQTRREEAMIPGEFAESIKPGMSAELKFGGNGSYPNLPWVSTVGSGPNGKTISGVTYRYSNNEVRIVCACHGFHLSPQDFVLHASEKQMEQQLPLV